MTAHDLDELASVDLPSEDERQGDGLPRIWWKYGTAPTTAGHFYARADDWQGELPDPWKPCELYENEQGWAANTLKLVLITKRSQPYRKVTLGGKTYREYVEWPRRGTPWPDQMQIHTEWIAFAEGLGGPVVFSYHGATGQAMEGKQGGIVASAEAALSKPATLLYKRKIGLSAFWIPIGPTLQPNGKPKFESLPQGSKINYPALTLPALEGKALLSACYVGSEILADVAMTKDAYAEWAKERRGGDAEAQVQSEPAPTGRNVPQPYDPSVDQPF